MLGFGQSNVRYYVYALLFVMFDVEAVFIFPWAVNLESLGTFGLVEMIVFIVILALGLVYAWRKGVLGGPSREGLPPEARAKPSPGS